MADGTTADTTSLDFGLVNQMMQLDIVFKEKMISMSSAITKFTDGLDQFKKTLPSSAKDVDTLDKKTAPQEATDKMKNVTGGSSIFGKLIERFDRSAAPDTTAESKKEDVFATEDKITKTMIVGISPEAMESFNEIFKDIKASGTPAGKKEEGGGGLLSKLFGGAGGLLSGAGGIMKFLPKIAGPLGAMATNPVTWLLAGIIWGVVDAFRGAKMAEQWGVSKTAGAMGGLLGGMDKGMSGAMKNMGKWALIGAGIGSFVPVVGTLIGGLIGAVVGAILGWIGGERIAKGFQAVTDFFTNVFTKIFDSIFVMGRWFQKLGYNIKDGFNKVVDYFKNFNLFQFVQDVKSFIFGLKDRLVEIVLNVKDKVVDFFKNFNLFDFVESVKEFGISIKDKFVNLVTKLKDMLFGLLNKLDPRGWFKKDPEKEATENIDSAKKSAESEKSKASGSESSSSVSAVVKDYDNTHPERPARMESDDELIEVTKKTAESNSKVFSDGLTKLHELQAKASQAIVAAVEKINAAKTTTIVAGGGGGESSSSARQDTAYDKAYEMRSRYWTAYTRGL
jgi:hypothetical protein